jgi:hypothetical protein
MHARIRKLFTQWQSVTIQHTYIFKFKVDSTKSNYVRAIETLWHNEKLFMLVHALMCTTDAPRSWLPHRASPATPTAVIQEATAALPTSFDWRNRNGQNFVSPVR